MDSKRKNRKVSKASKAVPELPKQPDLKAKPVQSPGPQSAEQLILRNAELVENLLKSEEWNTIVLPLLLESVAGVSGRYTNGRFYQGDFTRANKNYEWLAGYQCALEEFNNRIHDFLATRDKLIAQRKEEETNKNLPVVNSFLEELNET